MSHPKLQLIGYLSFDPKENIRFLTRTFPKLASEVKRMCKVVRHVQYESTSSDGDYVQFVGLEVEAIADIPLDMVAWVLGEHAWTVINSRNETIWHSDLAWNWLSKPNSERSIGEFAAIWPPEWSSEPSESLRKFTILSNSYLSPIDSPVDDIHLEDYDPSWPNKYEEMADWLAKGLGPEVARRIEHYGSTAIPGMPAKPVIDVLVEIPSLPEARKKAISLFDRPECEYWWYRDHMCFIVRESIAGARTHHIHMAPKDHRIWEGLAFRDYLKANSGDASRYASLKRELSERYKSDREAYTDAKSAFVREIAAKL